MTIITQSTNSMLIANKPCWYNSTWFIIPFYYIDPAPHSIMHSLDRDIIMPLNSCKKSNSHVDYFSEQVDSPNVLVIGGTSFIGSRIALGLRDIGYNVTLVDDWINLSIEPMAWYRQDKLVENKISVNYVDFSDVVSTNSLLAENNHGSIVYVPLLFDGKHEKTCSYDYLKSSILLKNFVTLLEKARACSLKIIFVTSNEEKAHSIQKALLKTFD